MDGQNLAGCCDLKNKPLITVFCTALTIFLLTLVVYFISATFIKIKQNQNIDQRVITVSDTAEVYAKPDLALVDLSVVTEAGTVAEALAKNTEKMNNVIDFLKNQGIEDKDLKTTYFNISPHYEYIEESGERVLAGYDATQQVSVKIRDMAKIGSILEGATSKGANQAGDLRFTIDQDDTLRAEARTQAIEKAKNKAKELALRLGVKLGKIAGFNEDFYDPFYYPMNEYAKGMGDASSVAPAPQIQTGENKITATVNITYEFK